MSSLRRWLTRLTHTPRRTCCAHPEAVYWNPYNRVVQCHACGHVWGPLRHYHFTPGGDQ